jgi:hypothetical protein
MVNYQHGSKAITFYIKIIICGGVKVPSISKQGVCHTMALPLTLKSILMQKKNYGNSKFSPCKK